MADMRAFSGTESKHLKAKDFLGKNLKVTISDVQFVEFERRDGSPADKKAILTCAVTGVLTDPAQHNVPVTPKQMAAAAREAHDAGAAIVHCHFRMQEEGMGRMPTWDTEVVSEICQAIKAEVPEIIIHLLRAGIG